MTEFQAALGISQLKKLERIIAGRRAAAARYDALLAETGLCPPTELEGSRHVYQSYTVLLPTGAGSRRAEIIRSLKSLGIEANIGTYHLPMTTCFRNMGLGRPGDFPCTDDIASRTVSLPLYETIAERDQEQVVAALAKATRDASA